jgi:glycosidase
MDLIKLILSAHSKVMKDKVVNHVGSDAKRFKELVNVFLAGPYRVTQRAAWPLSYCVGQHPTLIKPHLKTVLDYLSKPDIHDSVKRNTIRLLQGIDIPKSLQGKAANICFEYLSNPKEPIAVRVFSMTVLANIAKENPELKNEIISIIEDQLPFGSAGFRSRGAKVLKVLRT